MREQLCYTPNRDFDVFLYKFRLLAHVSHVFPGKESPKSIA
jgi:hypothetical protein